MEIRGRNDDIRVSGMYSQRKSKPAEKEYVLINDRSKKASSKKEAQGKKASKPGTSPEKSGDAPEKGGGVGRSFKSGIRKFAKKVVSSSVKSIKKSTTEALHTENELAETQDANNHADKLIKKIIKTIVSKVTALVFSIAGSFLTYMGICVVIIIAALAVIVSVKNATYDFIADEERFLREKVSRINSEFVSEINRLSEEAGCTDIVMQGKLTEWKDIIAFWWALKVYETDTDKWERFFTGDDYEDLKMLFYKFNIITSLAKDKTYVVTVNNASMDDMIKEYALSHEQRKKLKELLAAEEIWEKILYADELAAIAAGEMGRSRDVYTKWYPLPDGEDFNMAFVMYCLDSGGYLVPGCLTKTNDADALMREMLNRGFIRFSDGKQGDIIFMYMNKALKAGIITDVTKDAYLVTMGGYGESDVVFETAVSKKSGMIRCIGEIKAFEISFGEHMLPADVVMAGSLVWPASGQYYVTSCFKWRWGRQHQGIDIACPEGTPVLAAADGSVIISQYSESAGNYVMIDHGTYKTVYMHNSELKVMVGDRVTAGTVIALSGNTGNSTGPHLHFGVMVNGTYTDPAPYLGLPSDWEGDAGAYINASDN